MLICNDMHYKCRRCIQVFFCFPHAPSKKDALDQRFSWWRRQCASNGVLVGLSNCLLFNNWVGDPQRHLVVAWIRNGFSFQWHSYTQQLQYNGIPWLRVKGRKHSKVHGFSFLWCLVPFPVLCSPCVQRIKRKINPMKLLKVLWRLIFASSVCRKASLIHISNLKENITVSDSALFNRTEQNTQEGRL